VPEGRDLQVASGLGHPGDYGGKLALFGRIGDRDRCVFAGKRDRDDTDGGDPSRAPNQVAVDHQVGDAKTFEAVRQEARDLAGGRARSGAKEWVDGEWRTRIETGVARSDDEA
jgi:hypothetical protein